MFSTRPIRTSASLFPRVGPAFILLCQVLSVAPARSQQTSAFAYQGALNDGGHPATGIYDLRFALWDSANGGNQIGDPITNAAAKITNALLSATLDFGTVAFDESPRWLEIGVRTNSPTPSPYIALTPRQQLTPTPYALFAAQSATAARATSLSGTLPASQLTGSLPTGILSNYSGPVTLTNNASIFSGTFAGNGATLTNVPGTFAWVAASGTNVQAMSNTGYLLTNDQTVHVTLPPSPALGDIIRITGAGFGGWRLAQNPGQQVVNGSVSFRKTNVVNQLNLSCIALSADGARIAVGSFGGPICTSTNAGLAWSVTTAPKANWQSIASSSDGLSLAAAGPGIYTSINGGAIWVSNNLPANGVQEVEL